jgi:release factor glutamine methyltransferase
MLERPHSGSSSGVSRLARLFGRRAASPAKLEPLTMDVRSALKKAIARLREAQVPSFTLAAELLLLHVLNRDRTWLYAHPEEPVSVKDAEQLAAVLERRAAGEPTQYIIGKQEFWGLEFEVTPDVLIPRPETEHVVEVALDHLALREIHAGRKQTLTGEGLQVIDVGTGSGCLAIALAKELPQARFVATDISSAALAVAQRNAIRHSVADRVHFLQSNLFDSLFAPASTDAVWVVGAQDSFDALDKAARGPRASHRSPVTDKQSPLFDLVVSNPPYIGRREKGSLMREVRDHEPESALYGGEEGHEFYGDLVAQAASALKPGGLLALELGHNSLAAVQRLLDAPHWTNVGITKDLAGITRVIAAERTNLAPG